jgi:hypothetical protein
MVRAFFKPHTCKATSGQTSFKPMGFQQKTMRRKGEMAIGSIGFGDTGDGFVRTSFEKFGRSKKNRTGCSSIASMLSGQSNS